MTVAEREERKEEWDQFAKDEGGQGTGGSVGGLGDLLGPLAKKLGLPPQITSLLGGGGGGGGLEGIASVAGPVAIAGAVSKAVADMYKGVADFTRKVGDVGVSIAKNDGIGAITQVMDGFGEIAGKVPIVGDALQAQIDAYTQFLRTFDQLTAAFAERGEQLNKFSGPIAAASAQAEVTRLLADIREAQNLGNEYAAVISERTEMQVEFQKALEPIKRVIMQDLVVALKFINAQLKFFNNGIEGLQKLNEKSGGVLKLIGDTAISMAGIPGLIYSFLELVKRLPMFKAKPVNLEDLINIGRKGIDADAGVYRPDQSESVPLGIDLFDKMDM